MTKLPHYIKIYDRKSLICSKIEGERVLHIGCTDAPFTKERLQSSTLLHQDLGNFADYLVGIDINKEAISTMRNHGIKHIYHCSVYDLAKLSKKNINHNFSYIIITEVLEHLSNPGLALEEIAKYMKSNCKEAKLLITVPNLNSYLRNFFDTFANKEIVHPDHVSYYSYTTIVNLLKFSGFEIIDIRYVTYGLKKLTYFIAFLLNLFSSSFLPSIYILAKPKKKQF